MRAALVQLSSSDDPAANLPETERLLREAAAAGAVLVLTPEVTNIVSTSRARQREVLARDYHLAACVPTGPSRVRLVYRPGPGSVPAGCPSASALAAIA